MHHSEQKCAHFCSEWCIVGYGTGALWDLWIWCIRRHHACEQTLGWTRLYSLNIVLCNIFSIFIASKSLWILLKYAEGLLEPGKCHNTPETGRYRADTKKLLLITERYRIMKNNLYSHWAIYRKQKHIAQCTIVYSIPNAYLEPLKIHHCHSVCLKATEIGLIIL